MWNSLWLLSILSSSTRQINTTMNSSFSPLKWELIFHIRSSILQVSWLLEPWPPPGWSRIQKKKKKKKKNKKHPNSKTNQVKDSRSEQLHELTIFMKFDLLSLMRKIMKFKRNYPRARFARSWTMSRPRFKTRHGRSRNWKVHLLHGGPWYKPPPLRVVPRSNCIMNYSV